MAYRAWIRSQCATLATADILPFCGSVIQASFSKYEDTQQSCAETLDAVYWYIYEYQQTNIVASDGDRLWSEVTQAYGKRTVDDCLESGRLTASKTFSLNDQIQAAWPAGAYGAIGSQYHMGGLSIETLSLLAHASKLVSVDTAKQGLEEIMQERLSQPNSYAQRLLPKDVRVLIARHEGEAEAEATRSLRTRKRKRATRKRSTKASRHSRQRNTSEETAGDTEKSGDLENHGVKIVHGANESTGHASSVEASASLMESPSIEKGRGVAEPLLPNGNRHATMESGYLPGYESPEQQSPTPRFDSEPPSFSDPEVPTPFDDNLLQSFAFTSPFAPLRTSDMPNTSTARPMSPFLPEQWVTQMVNGNDFTLPEPVPERECPMLQSMNEAQRARHALRVAEKELDKWTTFGDRIESAWRIANSLLDRARTEQTETAEDLETSKRDVDIMKQILAQYQQLSPALRNEAQERSLEGTHQNASERVRTFSDRIEELQRKILNTKGCVRTLGKSHQSSIEGRYRADAFKTDALAQCRELELRLQALLKDTQSQLNELAGLGRDAFS